MTTLAYKVALLLTAPSSCNTQESGDELARLLAKDGYGPAERANICERLCECNASSPTFEEWVTHAGYALERA